MSYNTFLLEQYQYSKNFSYSNWINAAQVCFRTFEQQIRAMFGDVQNNRYSYYTLLNTKAHSKTSDCRCEANGLAMLKFARYYRDNDGNYVHDDYYCRPLFPKDGKVSIKWREEFDNLDYFVLFIDGDCIGYIDNRHAQFKKYLFAHGKSDKLYSQYKCLKIDTLYAAGLCHVYDIFMGESLVDHYDAQKHDFIKFKHLNRKLPPYILLHYDPKPTKRYVCYDGKKVSNKSLKEIVNYLQLKLNITTKRRLMEYIKKTSEAILDDKPIHAYNATTTNMSLLFFRKGLNKIQSKDELEAYLNSHKKLKYSQEERKYRQRLSEKLKRCKTKADIYKRFVQEDIQYMIRDILYLPIIDGLP